MIELTGVSKVFSIPHQKRNAAFDRVFGRGHYTFETFHALRDVTLRVEAGEFLGIVGRNGCGKSTLLRFVAGIYPPTTGTVHVGGAVAPILELGVGFNGALTVRDNVFLYGVLLGVPRRRLEAEVEAILDRAGIGRFEDAPLQTLSTGLRTRLAFTVALLADAPVLIVDEALAVGDERFQAQCVDELRRLKNEGRTAILVSHDPRLLGQLCARLVLIDAGDPGDDRRRQRLRGRHAGARAPAGARGAAGRQRDQPRLRGGGEPGRPPGRRPLPAAAWPAPGLLTLAYDAFRLHNLMPRSRLRLVTAPGGEAVDVVSLIEACLLVRRSAFEALGGLDERFLIYYEDTDLAVRARAAGHRVRLVPAAQAVHLVGGSSFQDRRAFRVRFHESRRRFLAKHHRGPKGAALRILHTAGLAVRSAIDRVRGLV